MPVGASKWRRDLSLISVRELIDKLSDWEQKNPGMFVVVGSFSSGRYAEILDKGTIYLMPDTGNVAVIKTRDRRKKTLVNSR